MNAGTGDAHCSPSGTNTQRIHTQEHTVVHACKVTQLMQKHRHRARDTNMPCAKVQSRVYTQRHTTYLNRQHGWTHSLDMVTKTCYLTAASRHIHQHTWAQKMQKRSLFHVFILSRIYSVPDVSRGLEHCLLVLITAPKKDWCFYHA